MRALWLNSAEGSKRRVSLRWEVMASCDMAPETTPLQPASSPEAIADPQCWTEVHDRRPAKDGLVRLLFVLRDVARRLELNLQPDVDEHAIDVELDRALDEPEGIDASWAVL